MSRSLPMKRGDLTRHALDLGVSIATVSRLRSRLVRLAPEARKALKEGRISEGQADNLVPLDPEVQRELLPDVMGLGVMQTRKIIAFRVNREKNLVRRLLKIQQEVGRMLDILKET